MNPIFSSPWRAGQEFSQAAFDLLTAKLSLNEVMMLQMIDWKGNPQTITDLEHIRMSFLALQTLFSVIKTSVFICPGDHANLPQHDGRRWRSIRGYAFDPRDGYEFYAESSCNGMIEIVIETEGEYGEYKYPVAIDAPDNTHNCSEMLNLNDGEWSGRIWGQYMERVRLHKMLAQVFGLELIDI